MDQNFSHYETDEENREIESVESGTLADRSNITGPSPNKHFRKYSWLNNHFDIIDKKVACKHCNKMYKNRHAPRLVGHIRANHREESEGGSDVILESGDSREINNLMVMSFIEANIPLRAVEMRSFKRWMKKMNTYWVPPSRRELSSVLIPRLSRKLHHEFQAVTLNLSGPSLSIEFDHWQDANGRSLLGVIATTPSGKRHLLDLRDVSEKGHFSSVIIEDLTDILKDIPSQAINSIVSDSASSCKKARAELIKLQNYSHIIQHRCTAHLLNRIEQRVMTKNQVISETYAAATRINSLISSSAFWQASIQRLHHKKIKQACPTRWYYAVDMIECLLDVKDVILETILPRVSEEKARMIRALDWIKLEAILAILKPINQCIGVCEAKDTSLGQAFRSLLNYTKELFDPEHSSEFGSSARAAFLWHFSPKRIDKSEFGLYIAAYVLDRRNKMKYITQDGLYLALETMALIVRSSVPLQRIKSSLIDEFEAYRNFRDDYAQEDTENNPVRWWSKKPSSILMQVAIRLAHLKASSSNIERTFSMLKQIQGGSRMNLSLSSLVDIGRLKIGTDVIYEEDTDEFDISSYELEAQQSSSSKRQCTDAEEVNIESQNDEQDSSEITDSRELSDWLETQDLETVSSYKWFFKFINFSVIFEETSVLGSQSEKVTEEQIRNLVQQSRDSQNYGIIIDSPSQAVQYDLESNNLFR